MYVISSLISGNMLILILYSDADSDISALLRIKRKLCLRLNCNKLIALWIHVRGLNRK